MIVADPAESQTASPPPSPSSSGTRIVRTGMIAPVGSAAP
jgi:hypothetical protein